MHPVFQLDQYFLKRQVMALTGKFRVYSPQGQLLLFCEQKMFRLREDLRVFADEGKTTELLQIQARQIVDFSAAYDVWDSQYRQKVGVLRRKGWRSMLRDEWEVLDAADRPLGILIEDDATRALLRRLLLGTLLPQNYDLLLGGEGGQPLADLRQHFHLFRYELEINFSMDPARRLDRRLGIAAGILLAAIEGRQQS